MDVTSRIAHLAEEPARAAGLVVDGVEIHHAGKHTRVVVTLDLPEDQLGSASLDAVAQASRGIGDALDAANVPTGPYTLEVSTPGLDRILNERRHFVRARGRLLSVQMRDGSAREGRLVEVEDDGIVLDSAGQVTTVPLAEVEGARIEIDWKAVPRDDAAGEDEE